MALCCLAAFSISLSVRGREFFSAGSFLGVTFMKLAWVLAFPQQGPEQVGSPSSEEISESFRA